MAFAAVSLVVATPASPAAAMPGDAVGYSAQACTMVGDGGADSLGGKGDRDVVCGRGGTDRIRGNGGHDVLLGGGGGDLLQGKTGSDLLNGGPGNDRAFGGAGADDLQGGPGIDGLGGGLGPDELSGGAGRDIVLYGQRGQSVRVSIGAGANDGLAGEGDDVHADVEAVQGGRGNDVLTGTAARTACSAEGARIVSLGRAEVTC
jgi:Ca2+-binding RTX toxin-like protein